MAEIQPNSPEAMAQARKVRSIFFLIAIGNIVLIAIVLLSRAKKPDPVPAPPTVEQPGR